MIDLTQNQIKELTIWAYDKLWDMMDSNSYDGDSWFTYDGDKLPELVGKIDLNIWDGGDEDPIVKGAVYVVDTPFRTNTENSVMLFGGTQQTFEG